MDFYIHSRESAVECSYNYKNTSTFAVISITDPNSEPNNFHDNVPEDRILRLQFYDIDRPVSDYKMFSVDEAKQILEFVEKQIAHVDFFIVHCEAGISRSAGVAAALSKIYNGTDEYIFNCRKYSPNMKVYRTILNEYYK